MQMLYNGNILKKTEKMCYNNVTKFWGRNSNVLKKIKILSMKEKKVLL